MIKHLKEKEWYEMKILNLVDLPGDGKYFIILDPFNRKHLLNASFYTKYKLNIGEAISCRVDKINCKGKIFFEPKHPFYNEGEVYQFNISEGIITDIYGKECYLEHKPAENEKSFVIKRIKKGKCYLERK